MSPRDINRIVLFVHGSPDPGWRRIFDALSQRVAASVGADRVRVAYLQFTTPSFADVVAEAAQDRVDCLRVLPVFLAVGAHVARDIPDQVEHARREHPGIVIDLLPAVGTDPRMARLLETMACEAAGELPRVTTGEYSSHG